jgi:hypothetical protein
MIDKIHIPTILLSHQNTSSLTPKFSWEFSESLNKLYHHNKQLASSKTWVPPHPNFHKNFLKAKQALPSQQTIGRF